MTFNAGTCRLLFRRLSLDGSFDGVLEVARGYTVKDGVVIGNITWSRHEVSGRVNMRRTMEGTNHWVVRFGGQTVWGSENFEWDQPEIYEGQQVQT